MPSDQTSGVHALRPQVSMPSDQTSGVHALRPQVPMPSDLRCPCPQTSCSCPQTSCSCPQTSGVHALRPHVHALRPQVFMPSDLICPQTSDVHALRPKTEAACLTESLQTKQHLESDPVEIRLLVSLRNFPFTKEPPPDPHTPPPPTTLRSAPAGHTGICPQPRPSRSRSLTASRPLLISEPHQMIH